MRYSIEWKYEQKEGFHRAESNGMATIGQILRLLAEDTESNRTYVRVFEAEEGSGLFSRVTLKDFSIKLGEDCCHQYLVDGEK